MDKPLDLSKFVGRDYELKALSWDPNRSRSKLSAVYGRRRIGKTSLVLKLAELSDLPVIKFEGLENQPTERQKEEFVNVLFEHSHDTSHRLAAGASWVDLFKLLSEFLASEPYIVFFDEFQWLAEEKPDLVSELKYAWDNFFSVNNRVHMIICGSVSSFIVKKVIESKALYGRIDTPVEVTPLGLGVLGDAFMPGRSIREQAIYYFAVGGIPKYFELYDNSMSVLLNLQRLGFSSSGYFYEELRRLFISHFGRSAVYPELVKLLSERKNLSRKEIISKMSLGSGGRITEYLTDLELAGFIESYKPISDSYQQVVRYRISDYFLRFYYRFIEPVHSRIKVKPLDLQQALPQQRFNIWLGLAYEYYCLQNAEQIAAALGFEAVRYEYGSWYSKPQAAAGVQVDLMYKRDDKVLVVCEIKSGPIQKSKVMNEMERKLEALKANLKPKYSSYSIEPVLITFDPNHDQFSNESLFRKVISISDFMAS